MPTAQPLAAWLDRIAGPLSPRRLAGLRWLFVDALFGQASGSFYEEFVALYALALGATADRIGALVGLSNLFGVVAYLPGAAMVGRLRTRKPFVLATNGGVARLAILAMAFVPLVAAGPGAAFTLILALRSVTVFMGSTGTPPGTSIVADLVPARARGRYFAGRNAAMGIVAFAAAPLAGLVASRLNRGTGGGTLGYQVLFAVSFAFGMLSTFSFSRIPEPPAPRGRHRAGDLRRIPGLLGRNPGFTWLVISSLAWSLAMNLAGPFFNVYLVRELGGTAANVGTSAGIYAATALVGQVVFGALVDRRGNRRLFILTGLLVPFLPVFWLLVHVPEQSYAINAASGFLWAGYNLAAYNLLLETVPPEDRETGVALHNTVVAVGAVAGPLLGGLLAGAVGYLALFVMSGAGRFAATLVYVAGTRGLSRRAALSPPSGASGAGTPGPAR
jgi:MFS family permease